MEVIMYQLLRTYLVGDDYKYELYGDVGISDKVTGLLEYSYRYISLEEKTAHWVCLGPVDISDFNDDSTNLNQDEPNVKKNDIQSVMEFCSKRAKR